MTKKRRPTANERLRDRAIRRGVLVERFKATEVQKIVAFWRDKLFPDLTERLAGKLARFSTRGAGALGLERFRELTRALDSAVVSAVRAAQDGLRESLLDLARSEAEWQVGAIRGAMPVTVALATPTAETLRRAVTTRPFQGKLLREWAQALDAGTRSRLHDAVAIGVTQGESIDQIVRRVRGTAAAGFEDGVMALTRRQAEAVVRTAVQGVATHARQAVVDANADMIDGVLWDATLDLRTCPVCAALEEQSRQKPFAVDSGPRPPAHFGCRCTFVPLLKSWKAVGIALAEAPEGTRASMDGQVPAQTTVAEFWARQPRAVQDEIMGPSRAAVFRRGTVDVGRLVDPRGRLLSVAELNALEARLDASG